jgi:hypothetical protein
VLEEKMGLIRLDLAAQDELPLLDLSAFTYDFELLYDLLVLYNLEEYSDYIYSQSLWRGLYGGRFWTRNGRPIILEHKLKVIAVEIHSPGSLILGAGAKIASQILVPLITAAGKIADWKFDRQKAHSEAEKSQQEALRASYEADTAFIKRDTAMIERDTAMIARRREAVRLSAEEIELAKTMAESKILRRLGKNSIKLIDISVSFPEDKKPNPRRP